MNLKFLGDADSFSESSTTLHLQAEGMVLTLFRLVMQDEARHVGYGVADELRRRGHGVMLFHAGAINRTARADSD